MADLQSKEIILGSISQPVQITGTNIFKKSLSRPQTSSISVTNSKPTLFPGTLKSGGSKKTRKVKRKTFKYKRCPTKRHFKI